MQELKSVHVNPALHTSDKVLKAWFWGELITLINRSNYNRLFLGVWNSNCLVLLLFFSGSRADFASYLLRLILLIIWLSSRYCSWLFLRWSKYLCVIYFVRIMRYIVDWHRWQHAFKVFHDIIDFKGVIGMSHWLHIHAIVVKVQYGSLSFREKRLIIIFLGLTTKLYKLEI